jgi:hypothetical protein
MQKLLKFLQKTELAFEGHNFREIYRLASKNAEARRAFDRLGNSSRGGVLKRDFPSYRAPRQLAIVIGNTVAEL